MSSLTLVMKNTVTFPFFWVTRQNALPWTLNKNSYLNNFPPKFTVLKSNLKKTQQSPPKTTTQTNQQINNPSPKNKKTPKPKQKTKKQPQNHHYKNQPKNTTKGEDFDLMPWNLGKPYGKK